MGIYGIRRCLERFLETRVGRVVLVVGGFATVVVIIAVLATPPRAGIPPAWLDPHAALTSDDPDDVSDAIGAIGIGYPSLRGIPAEAWVLMLDAGLRGMAQSSEIRGIIVRCATEVEAHGAVACARFETPGAEVWLREAADLSDRRVIAAAAMVARLVDELGCGDASIAQQLGDASADNDAAACRALFAAWSMA